MEQIKQICIEETTYALRDDSKLPQPEEALSDTFLKITEVEDGQVTAVTGVSVEELAQLVLDAIPDGDEVSY